MSGSIRGNAFVRDDLLVLASGGRIGDGVVTALDRFSGEVRWETTTDNPVEGGLAATQDRLLCGTIGFLGQDALLRCIRLSDGQTAWETVISGGVWSEPLVVDQQAYISTDDGRVHCFDIQTGEARSPWPVAIAEGRSWLAVVGLDLYAFCEGGQVYVIAASTGNIDTDRFFSIPGKLRAGPLVSSGTAFVGTTDGQVLAVDLASGSSRLLLEGLERVVSSPILSDGILYVGGHDHKLYALLPDTEETVWSVAHNRSFSSSPTAGEGLVFAGNNNGRVYAFDAKSGEEIWEYRLETEALLTGNPVFQEGVLYVGAYTGRLVALPWHLGRYKFAAEHLEKRNQPAAAARFYALAGALAAPPEREAYYQKAGQLSTGPVKLNLVSNLLRYGHQYKNRMQAESLPSSPDSVAEGTRWSEAEALEYINFDVLIEKIEDRYRVRVVRSPAGQAMMDFDEPFSELERENFNLKLGRPRQRTRSVRGYRDAELDIIKSFGERLYHSVFQDTVQLCLHTSLIETQRQNIGLRIRLRMDDAPDLINLPWEYLYNPTANRFFSLSISTPIVRYLELPEPPRPQAVELPLKVLVLISNPPDFPALNVEKEWRKLQDAMQDLIQKGQVQLDRLEQPTLPALLQRFRREDYHIFHFIGHGMYDDRTEDGLLAFEDEAKGTRLVTGLHLGIMLRDSRKLSLVVLNSCEGARTSTLDPFSGSCQSLVQQGIPAVIAMQYEITDDAAITFSNELYKAIADGYPVDAALAEARKAIFAEGNDLEWGYPALYMRSTSGRLFEFQK